MLKKCFVICDQFKDVFNEKFYIPAIEKLSFNLAHVRIIGSMECGKTRNDSYHDN